MRPIQSAAQLHHGPGPGNKTVKRHWGREGHLAASGAINHTMSIKQSPEDKSLFYTERVIESLKHLACGGSWSLNRSLSHHAKNKLPCNARRSCYIKLIQAH